MAIIITDAASLRQVSMPVDLTDPQTLNKDDLQPFDLVSRETEATIRSLTESLSDKDLGLAAPQIGEFERIFAARLSSGLYVFVNPHLKKSDATFASTEGCLSLPGVSRCVSRSVSISVEADIIYLVVNNEFFVGPKLPELYSIDSAIIQHEYDHLEGILLIDHPEAPDIQQKIMKLKQERRERIATKRQIRKAKLQHKAEQKLMKISTKRAKRLKKLHRQGQRIRKKRVEIEEFQKAIEEGAIEPSIP